MTIDKLRCQTFFRDKKATWCCFFTLFILVTISGCDRTNKNIRVPAEQQKQKATEAQEGEIVDSSLDKRLFEERKALWLKMKPDHYRYKFTYNCDCSYSTGYDSGIDKDGKPVHERAWLTIEVKDKQVVSITKDDGSRIPPEDYLPLKSLLEPVEYLWELVGKYGFNKTPDRLMLNYDKKLGYIRKIYLDVSGGTDDQFQGEIKDFTPLK